MVRKFLNIVTFNVRSLVNQSRRVELNMLLTNSNVDIAFLQELHLNGKYRVYLDNYFVISDHTKLGVGIAIKKSIVYSKVHIPGLNFPNLFIEINLSSNGHSKKYLLGSIYFPSNSNRSVLTDGLDSILNYSQNFDAMILGGDLNAKSISWNDTLDNFNGINLLNWLQNTSLSVRRICDVFPSFPNSSSYLDHFLVSSNIIDDSNKNYKVTALPTFSDHIPLKIQIFFADFDLILRTPDTFVSFKNINWATFKNDISNHILNHFPPNDKNLSNFEIDECIKKFEDSVESVSRLHFREIEMKNKKFFVSEKVKNLLKIKYKWQKDLKKIFSRLFNRTSPQYLLISKQIELIKVIIKQQIENELSSHFKEKLRKIKPGPWAYKQIVGIIGKNRKSAVKRICVNGVELEDLNVKLNTVKEHFEAIYSKSVFNRDVSHIEDGISRELSKLPGTICVFDEFSTSSNPQDVGTFTTLDNVINISHLMNNKKSFGPDKISNYLLKKFSIKAFEFLTIIYNNCINNCYFPDAWKLAKIIPIYKTNGNNSINALRPISLLSNLGKLFERIIREKMDLIISPDYISENQFGFKRKNSTSHALLKFQSDVVQNLRSRKCTVAVSLDVEKAFDKAYHDGILFKLIRIGFPPKIVKLIKSFFCDRKFFVLIDKTLSTRGDISCGVPQGSVLAPHLYSILIYDFPHRFNESKGILYADDSLLYAHDESPSIALQRVSLHLEHVQNFYSDWGIKINASKSKALCLRNASGKCKRFVVPQSKNLKLFLNNNEIKFGNSFKYLGITFNKLLKFNDQVRLNLQKANRMKGAFSKLFNSKYLSKDTKLLLYKVSIRPILLYAFSIWFTISPTLMKKMEIFERHILRKCIDKNFVSFEKRFSNRDIYDFSSISPLSCYSLENLRRFVNSLENFDGTIIPDIVSSEMMFSWTNTNYLSCVGILSEDVHNIGNFFVKASPGTHRG